VRVRFRGWSEHSVKGDMKGSMQAKAKQYKIDLGVCKETVTGLTAKVRAPLLHSRPPLCRSDPPWRPDP